MKEPLLLLLLLRVSTRKPSCQTCCRWLVERGEEGRGGEEGRRPVEVGRLGKGGQMSSPPQSKNKPLFFPGRLLST